MGGRTWSVAGAHFDEIIATLLTFEGGFERPVWGEQFRQVPLNEL